MSSATVHLLRHGQVHNPDAIVYGRMPDFHLSELGARMAEAAAADFRARVNQGDRYVVLASSPLTRARETAAPVARELGLDVVTEERIIEPRNHFQGLHVDEKVLSHPKHWPYMLNPLRPSWGESYDSIAARMMAAAGAAREFAEGREIVLVSHELCVWTARQFAEGNRLWHDPRKRECRLASVTTLTYHGDALSSVAYAEPCADL